MWVHFSYEIVMVNKIGSIWNFIQKGKGHFGVVEVCFATKDFSVVTPELQKSVNDKVAVLWTLSTLGLKQKFSYKQTKSIADKIFRRWNKECMRYFEIAFVFRLQLQFKHGFTWNTDVIDGETSLVRQLCHYTTVV